LLTNPFFVKMREGAEKGAAEQGIALQSFAGEKDGDATPQITAIENCVAAGVKGILITPSNDDVGPALKAARAAGILVISLDTELGDKEAQDITFATDNFQAGILIGQWAKAAMGEGAATAKIAMLDINKDNISVDVQRNTGFLTGFGIEVRKPIRALSVTNRRKQAQQAARRPWKSCSQKIRPSTWFIRSTNQPPKALMPR
jgi:fructose transport system substrate-binding protein